LGSSVAGKGKIYETVFFEKKAKINFAGEFCPVCLLQEV
jgi:hypothetical protein